MRAQASSEFIIIFGAILAISLAAMAVGVVWPSFSQSVEKQESDDYWRGARPFSIEEQGIYPQGMLLVIRNNDPVTLNLTLVEAEGNGFWFYSHPLPFSWENKTDCAQTSSCNLQIGPGKAAIISLYDSFSASGKNPCVSNGAFEAGKWYAVDISFIYRGAGLGEEEKQNGSFALYGKCTN